MLGSVQPSVAQATITVTTTDDELNTDGDCALREAICAANLNHAVDRCAAGSDTDVITIPAGTYTLTRSGVDNTANSGDLDLMGTITLCGTNAQTTIIDVNIIDRGSMCSLMPTLRSAILPYVVALHGTMSMIKMIPALESATAAP